MELALQVPRMLAAAGAQKITFAGGEPTLCPYLIDLLKESKAAGLTTGIVTNGWLLNERFIEKMRPYTDWIALSIDSASDEVEASLGRGQGNHVSRARKIAPLIRHSGIHLKINTTVTSQTWREDMHPLIRELKPERWKVFQVLLIHGENDAFMIDGGVTREQFEDFVRRHADLNPVVEDNDAMTGSYVMLDPIGRFFQNTHGMLEVSDSISDRGVLAALDQVGWDKDKFVSRGGLYDWKRPDDGRGASKSPK